MSSEASANYIAMTEKDGSCKDIRMGKSGGCMLMFVFGVLVIAGLVTIIVMQSKMLKSLQKIAAKKK